MKKFELREHKNSEKWRNERWNCSNRWAQHLGHYSGCRAVEPNPFYTQVPVSDSIRKVWTKSLGTVESVGGYYNRQYHPYKREYSRQRSCVCVHLKLRTNGSAFRDFLFSIHFILNFHQKRSKMSSFLVKVFTNMVSQIFAMIWKSQLIKIAFDNIFFT